MTQKIEQLLRRGAPNMQDIGGEAGAAARRVSERAAAEGFADISYAPVDSPFGTLHAATTKRGLVRVAFPEESLSLIHI